ncbi:MAG: T9SS type A sorting domain-containing protein [Candidatus Eiseniibacteriota bacterium]
MHPRRLALPVLALACAPAVPTAFAFPIIDDFETGSFHLSISVPPSVSGSYAVPSPSHAFAPLREVTLDQDGGGAIADVAPGTRVDDELVFHTGAGGKVTLIYQPSGPIDLSAGGQNDRIDVDFGIITAGGTLGVSLGDAGGGAYSTFPLAPGPGSGVVSVPFAPWVGVVNLSQITSIVLWVEHSDFADYSIRDIRAMRKDAVPMTFDVPTAVVIGPPYPSQPVQFTLSDENPAGTQEIRVLDAVKTVSGAATHLALQGVDSGGDTGPGEVGAVSWSWNETGRPWADSSFDLQVDVNAVSGVSPDPFLPALPVLTPTSTGFLLTFDVLYQDGAGPVVMTSRREMAFDAGPGQALSFAGAMVHPPALRAAGPSTGFRVTFDLIGGAAVDEAEPLFETLCTGDCAPAAPTAAPVVLPLPGAQALRAIPAVTRGGTELRLERPAGAAGRIELFDVSGRLLRQLVVRRGAAVVAWDGRVDGGVAASGVYFARFTDGSTACSTRIVKVR